MMTRPASASHEESSHLEFPASGAGDQAFTTSLRLDGHTERDKSSRKV